MAQPSASSPVLFLLVLCSLVCHPAAALSWPVCDNGGSVWVTEAPHTEATFPGSDLMFFCESGLNIVGAPVSPCVNNGAVCTTAVADSICATLGYDASWGEDLALATAQPGEPVQSLTGELCLREGIWAATAPDNVEALPGTPCQKVDKLTCIRYRKTMVAALASKHLQTLRPAPTTEAGTATSTSSAAPTRTELSASPVQAAGGPSGRKMIR